MRFKNIIYVTILVLTTVITSWSIPALVKKIVYESNGYPLMYYSSRLKCISTFAIRFSLAADELQAPGYEWKLARLT